jgi:hypothetical protein
LKKYCSPPCMMLSLSENFPAFPKQLKLGNNILDTPNC